MNIAIVDDELADSARLNSFVRDWLCTSSYEAGKIYRYSSGEDILKSFVPGVLQVIFMDILMGSTNGVDVARQIRYRDSEVLIIFLTTSKEFVFDAFPIHAFDYIIKPCTKKNVNNVLNEAAKTLDAYVPRVTIKISNSDYILPINKISSAVSFGHTVEISLADGKCILSNMKFREVSDILLKHDCFLLCNKGLIVNMSHVSAMNDGIFTMKNGTVYPIKFRGRAQIIAAFSQYLITNMKAGNFFPHRERQ